MRIIMLGNGVHEFEKNVKEALKDHEVIHFGVDSQGVAFRNGLASDLLSHIPHANVAICFPHYKHHDEHVSLLRDHGLPVLHGKTDFHHIFPDTDKIKNIISNHGFKNPLHHRLNRDELTEEKLRGLSQVMHLPVRVSPYGKLVEHEYFANTFPALYKAIEEVAKDSPTIDLTKHVAGDRVSVFAVPNFRNESVYVTLPGVHGTGGFSLAKYLDKEIRRQVENLARELYHVFAPSHALRVDMIYPYIVATRPVSALRPQPTFFEAMNFAGITTREYYKHLLEKVVG